VQSKAHLDEHDSDEPVVYVEVGNNIVLGDLSESTVRSPNTQRSEEKTQSDVGSDDLVPVSLIEDGRRRLEVVRPFGVGLLTRSVSNEVERPTEELLSEEGEEDDDGRVVDGLDELGLPLLGDVEPVDVLLGLVEGRVGHLLSSSRNEDFVSILVTGSGVMSTVGDPPGVVRDSKS